jgi:hypothetical protein
MDILPEEVLLKRERKMTHLLLYASAHLFKQILQYCRLIVLALQQKQLVNIV